MGEAYELQTLIHRHAGPIKETTHSANTDVLSHSLLVKRAREWTHLPVYKL